MGHTGPMASTYRVRANPDIPNGVAEGGDTTRPPIITICRRLYQFQAKQSGNLDGGAEFA